MVKRYNKLRILRKQPLARDLILRSLNEPGEYGVLRYVSKKLSAQASDKGIPFQQNMYN